MKKFLFLLKIILDEIGFTIKSLFKRIFCTFLAVFFCVGTAKSITPDELHEQIKQAYIDVKQAELRLKLKAPHLTEFWIRENTNEEGHKAELELRRLYPKEYMDYITAKIDLDDLLYTQYLMFANGKAE